MNLRIYFIFFLTHMTLVGLFTISCKRPDKSKSLTDSPPVVQRDSLFDHVQRQTFSYFYEGAEPISGMARERIHIDNKYPQNDQDVVTSGGSGFGVMSLIVGMERGYISREQGREIIGRILTFLEKADSYHGVWPHWWFGPTGKTKPFSKKDNGGDLVETSFMAQGLLCLRQYFKDGNDAEKSLANRADQLWRNIEFDWHLKEKDGHPVLFWHWSPEYQWEMNFPVYGYNECLIMYVLAASSPTHSIPAAAYTKGWAQNGKIKSDKFHYKQDTLQFYYQGEPPHGGPLFWAHYSFLGLDPRGLTDQYGDYEKEMKSLANINYNWCVDNPKMYKGYGSDSWGLTASYSVKGYAAHAPDEKSDLGVISPTAALSSFPYTPDESMAAMVNWYQNKQEKLWGPHGFYDAFSDTEQWYPQRYLAIDQGPIVVMMENHRSGLIWDLFMSCPEIKAGLSKLGFSSPHLSEK